MSEDSKEDSKENRVYKGGAMPPSDPIVDQQFKAGRVYRNKLLEIELARRKRFREAETLDTDVRIARDAITGLEAALEKARDQLQTEKSRQRTKNPKADAIRSSISDLISALRTANGQLKQAKSVLRSLQKDFDLAPIAAKLVKLKAELKADGKAVFGQVKQAKIVLLQKDLDAADPVVASLAIKLAETKKAQKADRKSAASDLDPKAGQKRRKARKILIAQVEEEYKAARARVAAAMDPTHVLAAKIKCLIEDSDAEAEQAAKAAYNASEAFWGTKLLVNKAAVAFRKSKTDPKFRKWDGSGRIGIQLMGGLSVAKALAGTDSRLQITAPSEIAWRKPETVSHEPKKNEDEKFAVRLTRAGKATKWTKKHEMWTHPNNLPLLLQKGWSVDPASEPVLAAWRQSCADALAVPETDRILSTGDRGRLQRTTEVRMVLAVLKKDKPKEGEPKEGEPKEGEPKEGKPEKANPIAITVRFNFHRPLPADGIITWVWLRRDRFERHELQFTLSAESLRKVQVKGPAVGINFGWRSRRDEDSLRVGYFYDETGHHGEICLPDGAKSYLNHPDTLRSTRDDNFNVMRNALAAWKASHDLPKALADQLQYIDKWKSPAKLRVIVRNWVACPGDETILPELRAWRKQDLHLYEWEHNERSQALAWRKDFYRCFFKDLASRYGRIFIEKFDLRKVVELPLPEEEDSDQTRGKARGQRFRAAIGEARSVLHNAAGSAVELVEAFNNTIQCYHCGHDETWDKAPAIEHRCAGCNRVWDQDKNNAQNVLARGLKGDAPAPADASDGNDEQPIDDDSHEEDARDDIAE